MQPNPLRSGVSGKIAQLVEQRTENPCVPGSIPGLATILRFAQRRRRMPSEALAQEGTLPQTDKLRMAGH